MKEKRKLDVCVCPIAASVVPASFAGMLSVVTSLNAVEKTFWFILINLDCSLGESGWIGFT